MGMFDSLYDRRGNEWQTKAYGCALDKYRIGDELPGPFETYQVEVFGGSYDSAKYRDAYATVRDGILASLPDVRDEHLPLMTYHGGPPMRGGR